MEISMRAVLASLVLFSCAACSRPASAPAEPAAEAGDLAGANADGAGDEKTIEDFRAGSLAQIDRAACEAAGGVVRQEGMLGLYRCVTPYADAGKACRGDADCEGKCLATDNAAPEAETVGACQANDSPFGCYAEVEGGRVTAAICVD
jgi:hypothetical protein